MNIETSDLGLAAYMKMKGLSLVSCTGRVFVFDCKSDDSCELVKREMEVDYANSCCRQHDSTVVYLRSMISPQNKIRG